jgi:hypothetical protein
LAYSPENRATLYYSVHPFRREAHDPASTQRPATDRIFWGYFFFLGLYSNPGHRIAIFIRATQRETEPSDGAYAKIIKGTFMGTLFSDLLVKNRKNAGFRTAYAFFHSNGGQDVLKVSYRKYLRMEQGELLPKFNKLGVYLYALRLFPRSYLAAEFISAWLKTSLGEEGFQQLLAPFFNFPTEQSISSPLHKAINKSLAHDKVQISPEQMEAIVHDRATYLAWMLLSNDTGLWGLAALAAAAGISVSSTGTALKRLAKAGLLKHKNGKYRCHLAGAMIEYPHLRTLSSKPGLAERLNALREEMFSSGEIIYHRRGTIRASITELSNLFPLLSLNLSTANTYSITEKQKDSAIFGMECRVLKLRDF